MVPAAVAVLLLLAAGPARAGDGERWFRMGFTPFNYDITDEAQQEVYDLVNPRQDVIAHQVDGGVPWVELEAGEPYQQDVEDDLATRLSSTPPGMTIYLATTPLNPGRDDLANYWGEDKNLPRPGEWANRTFDDPETIAAYLDWCRDLLDRFHPRYFNYAMESVELAHNAPEKWDSFMGLVRAVYPALKREYPAVEIFVSITLRDSGTPEMEELRPYIGEVMAYSDMMTVSTYRYIFGSGPDKGNPANLPPDWLSQAVDMAPDKPFAVAETGWLAENLSIPEWDLYVEGNPTWQDEYLETLLEESDRLGARFTTWFLAVDYDRLYWWLVLTGQATPEWLLWKDTGLWDGNVVPRPSLDTWEAWKALPRVPVPPPVPGGAWAGEQVTVSRAGGDELTVTWDATTCPAAGYHLEWLDLAAFPDYRVVGETCEAGTTGSWTGTPPPGDALGVLVVGDDGATLEGTHGRDSAGGERPTRSTACTFTRKLTDGTCGGP